VAQRFYSVMVKPGAPPAEAVFLRDGFAFGPFVFTVLWALYRRLWLAALFIAAGFAALMLLGSALAWPPEASAAGEVVLALLVGFEGNAWRRATLEHRGWVEAAVIAAPSLAAAEQRFFATMPGAALA